MSEERELLEKIRELKEELRRNGLWKLTRPDWVTDFEKKEISSHHDFTDWLQFVYIPNILEQPDVISAVTSKSYVALQAKKFFSQDVQKGKLLQLLIELDSLL
jgi:uncharacterized protein YqcC (DUF446 family)